MLTLSGEQPHLAPTTKSAKQAESEEGLLISYSSQLLVNGTEQSKLL